MNKVVRTVEKMHTFQLQKSLFHSSPILERRRRTNWESRFSHYNKGSRKVNGRWETLENLSTAFDEDLFYQRFRDDFDEDHPSSEQTQSSKKKWFMPDFDFGKGRSRSTGPKPRSKPRSKPGRRFDFCDDDDFEVEHTFHASFEEDKDFFYTFTSKDFEGDYHSSYNSRSRRNRRRDFDYDYEFPEEPHCSSTDSVSASYRLTLGLKASGPLKLEDVKNAYRTCALKWHPDRHQGSSKAVAEEKFKVCSAAYQSLCDRLAVS